MSNENANAGIDFEDTQSESGFTVDLNEVEDGGFEVLPKGIYNCVVSELNFEYSQNSGNPMWSWVLEVNEGEYAGQKLFFHTVWKGKGLPITKKAIKEVAPELFEAPFDPEVVAAEGTLLGRQVRARVDIRTYEGTKRNNVKALMKAAEGSDFL